MYQGALTRNIIIIEPSFCPGFRYTPTNLKPYKAIITGAAERGVMSFRPQFFTSATDTIYGKSEAIKETSLFDSTIYRYQINLVTRLNLNSTQLVVLTDHDFI